MRKNNLVRLAVACLLASSIPMLIAGIASSGPRIEFQELTYEWGDVLEGETVTHAFQFRNAGNELLRIHDVRSS